MGITTFNFHQRIIATRVKFAIIERGTRYAIVQFKTFDATVRALVAVHKRGPTSLGIPELVLSGLKSSTSGRVGWGSWPELSAEPKLQYSIMIYCPLTAVFSLT
jgi:hypothetical protein